MDEERYADAEGLLVAEAAGYPEDELEVAYFRSCLAARQGEYGRSVELLREALDRGHWYGEAMIRQSPSWRPLQGRPDFEAVAEESMACERAAAGPARYFTALPENAAAPFATVIALHGNGQNGRDSLAGWRCLTESGRLVAAVQSSQMAMADAYAWHDEETGSRDVVEQFAALGAEHDLDSGDLLIAGFSMGAEQALRTALTGAIGARGFILLNSGGPYTADPDKWLPLIERHRASGRALRGYVFAGEHDETPPEKHRRLPELLTDRGIPCEFEVLPGLDHEYPEDFRPALRRALDFLG